MKTSHGVLAALLLASFSAQAQGPSSTPKGTLFRETAVPVSHFANDKLIEVKKLHEEYLKKHRDVSSFPDSAKANMALLTVLNDIIGDGQEVRLTAVYLTKADGDTSITRAEEPLISSRGFEGHVDGLGKLKWDLRPKLVSAKILPKFADSKDLAYGQIKLEIEMKGEFGTMKTEIRSTRYYVVSSDKLFATDTIYLFDTDAKKVLELKKKK